MTRPDELELDNPVYAALTGPHARFAEACGRAVRYAADIAPFMALPAEPTAEDWADAARLVGQGGFVAVTALQAGPDAPEGWTVVREFGLVQMVEEDLRGLEDPEAMLLGRDDVGEVLELVRATEPGPFLGRTIELGRYLGIRRDGGLVAMAGERMALDGWREISAVCTAPSHRGHGLAARLVGAIAAGIHARSERVFLHVAATNTPAIGLYQRLGLRIRAEGTIRVMAPAPVDQSRRRRSRK
jgi:ribosomal protein S18 acetylase RimI-like enzyme